MNPSSSRSVFIDTSGWVAALVGTAQFHAQADALLQGFRLHRTRLVTSVVVLSELSALLTSRHYRLPQAQMLAEVDGIRLIPTLTVVNLTPVLDRMAWAYMRAHASERWSHCDAVSMTIMRNLGIVEALTADHHFADAGFTRLLAAP